MESHAERAHVLRGLPKTSVVETLMTPRVDVAALEEMSEVSGLSELSPPDPRADFRNGTP
jgi:hypothetical protein